MRRLVHEVWTNEGLRVWVGESEDGNGECTVRVWSVC